MRRLLAHLMLLVSIAAAALVIPGAASVVAIGAAAIAGIALGTIMGIAATADWSASRRPWVRRWAPRLVGFSAGTVTIGPLVLFAITPLPLPPVVAFCVKFMLAAGFAGGLTLRIMRPLPASKPDRPTLRV